MDIIVKLATNEAQKAEAFRLLRDVYLKHFKIDLDEYSSLIKSFDSQVIIACKLGAEDEILGTISLIYPNPMFASEILFGYDLRELHGQNNLEVGRLAVLENSNPLVVILLFLAAIKVAKKRGIHSWISTVKSDMLAFFTNGLQLPHRRLDQNCAVSETSSLQNYVANGICIFEADLGETARCFSKFEKYLQNKTIQLD